MRRPSGPLRAIAILAGLAAGCEHGITLRGSVTVPPEAQRSLSPKSPGMLLVSGSIPKTSGFRYRVAVLCAPSSAAVVAPFFHDGFGCAKEGVVEARLVALAPADAPPCGVEQARWEEDPPGALLASGRQTVFSGETSSFGCSSGEDSVSIVLRPER